MMDKKKRGPRTSQKQYEIYITFLKENAEFRFGKLNAENSERINGLWITLTKKLNSCGSGAVKTVEDWKRSFTEWRSSVRRRSRNGESLKDTEKLILSLTGEVAVKGLPNIPEHGLEDKLTDISEIEEDEQWETINVQYEEAVIENEDQIVAENVLIDVENIHLDSQNEREEPKNQDGRVGKTAKYKKKYMTKSALSLQYEKSVSANKAGLMAIADALNNIATAINSGLSQIADKLPDNKK